MFWLVAAQLVCFLARSNKSLLRWGKAPYLNVDTFFFLSFITVNEMIECFKSRLIVTVENIAVRSLSINWVTVLRQNKTDETIVIIHCVVIDLQNKLSVLSK